MSGFDYPLQIEHIPDEFFSDAMNVFFRGGRILLDQRACLVKLHAEGIELLGSKLSLLFVSAGFAELNSVPGETSNGVPGLIACTYSHGSAPY